MMEAVQKAALAMVCRIAGAALSGYIYRFVLFMDVYCMYTVFHVRPPYYDCNQGPAVIKYLCVKRIPISAGRLFICRYKGFYFPL